ncbi:ribonuclease III family protein [Pseudanabaena sp. PCC 6802]|uniref:ribonuclease III family protein n=1 Tax=Pseudanabaena sp. PCC 6802 TaxID=118173 RepID=UPI00034D63D3|nr:ribonuclease III domain-containing protein [Pseudanabaena sp. PCC 6802]
MIDPRRQRELNRLLAHLGIDSSHKINWQILDLSLVHPSYSTTTNNDVLEFVGDSVLRLATSMWLHENYSDRKVGELAALRSHLVSDRVIAEIAAVYDLDRLLVMSNAARNDATAVRSRLAAGLEAVLAALYLSTNDFSLIRSWLDPHLEQAAQKLMSEPALGNYKVALQELTQARWKLLPQYQTLDPQDAEDDGAGNKTGTDGQELFTVEVWVADRCWGKGQGKSIKAAQQAAAAVALQALQARG